MGIELPTELAGVAAAAGVQWPKADEDAMRATAQAWRQAGTQTSTLAVDADHTAGRALSVVQGTAGTAATRHWQTFAAPDTGHLSRAAQGCVDAADRLDHAADQVGAAKVQIVRHLVTLAQHTDAANQAAAAGHPSALAGLPIAVQGTAVNVAHVNHTLTNSIALPAPTRGVDPLAANGLLSHGGPLGHTVDSVAGPVAHPPASAGGTALGAAGGTALGAAGAVPGHIVPPGDASIPVNPPRGLLPGGSPLVGPPPVGPPAGPPPVPSDPTAGANQPLNHPGPPLPGTPNAPDVTVAQSAAPPAAPPPVAAAPPGVAPAQPSAITPTQNDIWPAAAPTPGPITDPAPIASPTPTGGSTPTIPGPAPASGPTPAGPAPTSGQTPAGPGAAAGPAATSGRTPASPTPTAGRAPTAGPAPTAGATPTAGSSPTQPPTGNSPSGAIGAVTTAPPPRSGARSAVASPPTVAPPAIQATPPAQRDDLALFLMYLFPEGHQPADANRPVGRQLPPPPPDTDFAAGLRFPPHDHPESHRITAEPPTEPTPPSPPQPAPTDLTDGYDPLGYENQNEHDWDRRFVVRAGVPAEYAWPLFQEGGCTDGEPVVLEPGTLVDRFGTPEGRVFGEAGASYKTRSLPPDHLDAGYRRYRVIQELPAWRALSAPWFGQPGGAVRLRSVYAAADLVAFGYLAEETHGQ